MISIGSARYIIYYTWIRISKTKSLYMPSHPRKIGSLTNRSLDFFSTLADAETQKQYRVGECFRYSNRVQHLKIGVKKTISRDAIMWTCSSSFVPFFFLRNVLRNESNITEYIIKNSVQKIHKTKNIKLYIIQTIYVLSYYNRNADNR